MQMVVEFSEPCNSCCEQPVIVQSEVHAFARSFLQLSNEQMLSAVKINRTDILNQVSQLVPCVGCRHRLIILFYQFGCVVIVSFSALPPMLVVVYAAVIIDGMFNLRSFSLVHLSI